MKKTNRMTSAFITLLLVSLCLGQKSRRSNPDLTSVEQYIRESEAKLAQSVATSNTSDFERLVADDFIGTDPNGNSYTKAQMIAQTNDTSNHFVSNRLDPITLKFFGNTAVTQGGETWERRSGERGRFVWTHTWVLRKGRWQIVASQDMKVAGSSPITKAWTDAADPLTMAPDHYKLVFENDRVRVLSFLSRPSEKWGAHRHPDGVHVSLSEYDLRNVVPGNAATEIHRKPGDVRWVPATIHTGQNIGSTDMRSLIIELKR
jgi:hypothetical protein